MIPVKIIRGSSPVILGFPHAGTDVPPAVYERLNDNGRLLADTDWHIDRLYDGLLPNATTVRATFHRYVIDANRDPSGESLYPGQNTTALIPTTDFDGSPIWRESQEPGDREVTSRLAEFHAPYHVALINEIARVKSLHGLVVLYDCHSIRSHIPFLFEGILPDFNVGTNNGQACSPAVESAVIGAIRRADGFTHVLNGRFKGGWTTRRYGHPAKSVHAVQMELAQSTHLCSEAFPFAYDPAKSEKLRVCLKTVLERVEQTALQIERERRYP